jgi:hypothetical protein
LWTFHTVLKTLLGSFHLYAVISGVLDERNQRSYSGLWPTSMKAACGLSSPEKVASRAGMAATTSGHHALFVCGSFEARKTRKKASVEAGGNSRSPMAWGKAKSCEIGMMLAEVC